MRRHTAVPLAVGFGISTPAQAAQVGQVADGVIVGSALINAVDASEDKGGSGRAVCKIIAGGFAAIGKVGKGGRTRKFYLLCDSYCVISSGTHAGHCVYSGGTKLCQSRPGRDGRCQIGAMVLGTFAKRSWLWHGHGRCRHHSTTICWGRSKFGRVLGL